MELMMESQVFVVLFLMAAVILLVVWVGRTILARKARGFDFETVRSYLSAVPQTEAQMLDATDLALKGLVMTVLGILFAPLMFVGLLPLYYGFRKLILVQMNVALTDSEAV
jgi:hypothetical protein